MGSEVRLKSERRRTTRSYTGGGSQGSTRCWTWCKRRYGAQIGRALDFVLGEVVGEKLGGVLGKLFDKKLGLVLGDGLDDGLGDGRVLNQNHRVESQTSS